MKIVSKCPFCQKKLRFPVNKGKLLLKCPKCGNQFVFDPNIKKMFKALIEKFKYKFNVYQYKTGLLIKKLWKRKRNST